MRILAGLIPLLLLSAIPGYAQQDPPAPQCCQDIFYAGYNLGCAAGMCDWQFADESLNTFLTNSSRFVARAYADCSRINPAWTNWRQYSGDYERLAARLQGRVDANDFRTAASWLHAQRDSLAGALRKQIVANRYEAIPTCEEYYFRFGFDLGNALISISIAGSGSMNPDARRSAYEDALGSIYRARTDLDNLRLVRPVTGACVSLEELRSSLANVYPSPDLARAGEVRALLQNIVSRAETLLQGCGRAAGGPSPFAAAGAWNVVYLQRGSDGRFHATSEDRVELTTTRGSYGMLLGAGHDDETAEWYIVGDELRIVDVRGAVRMRYRYVDENTWLLLEMISGEERVSALDDANLRIQLQR